MSEAVERLRDELIAVVDRVVNEHDASAFDAVASELRDCGPSRRVPPVSQPVVDQWLLEAIAAAPAPWTDLARLLGEATPDLQWLKSYESLEESDELMKFKPFYSFLLLASGEFRGYEPPLLVDDMLIGFSLQAPNIFYPQHHHVAPELYGIISGTFEWQVGDTWSTKGPGDVIIHRPHESHAMRTSDAPALTWAVWSSDSDCDVFMPSLDPADHTMDPIRY